MKFKPTALLGLTLAWAAAGLAQTTAVPDAKKPSAPASPSAAKKDEAKKKADAKKKEVKIGKIDGMEIARGEGFIGVQIVNGIFKLRAYNATKNPVAADFTKVALRWNVQYQKNPERTLLTPSEGVGTFASEKIVKPPYSFKLFITLIKGEGDDAPVENFTVDFKSP